MQFLVFLFWGRGAKSINKMTKCNCTMPDFPFFITNQQLKLAYQQKLNWKTKQVE